jgi:ParB family chromosome partitioning protein
MGRGLSAILAVSEQAPDGEQELRELALELIEPNRSQPRRGFDEDSLRGLADSLRERGVLQPVLVRPRPGGSFELIAGERRWRAAQLAGMPSIPALVREGDDAASLELALIENMAREDLSPVEEARACAALVEELGLTHEDVGRRVGRSRVAVSNLLRLLDLPDEVLDQLQAGTLSEGHGRALLLVEDHDARRRLGRAAASGGWSVRVTERRAREASTDGAAPAPRARISGPRAGVHPDQEQLASEIADTLQRALGADVEVRAARDGGYTAMIAFDSAERAFELAERLGATAAS